MPITKTTYFNQKQNALASIAKALGHPARIAILQVLMKHETCVCNDIVMELPLAQATISQHLKVLKDAGLVKGDIAPNKRWMDDSCYCINPEGWEHAKDMLGSFWEGYKEQDKDLCCE